MRSRGIKVLIVCMAFVRSAAGFHNGTAPLLEKEPVSRQVRRLQLLLYRIHVLQRRPSAAAERNDLGPFIFTLLPPSDERLAFGACAVSARRRRDGLVAREARQLRPVGRGSHGYGHRQSESTPRRRLSGQLICPDEGVFVFWPIDKQY